ncbi:MAG: hypothetical protein ACI9G9_000194 [Psychromonas sp.]|jgi:hypothetical protein
MKIVLVLFVILSSLSNAQTTIKSLPAELNELSGLVFINDTLMAGHNDGGHKPEIFFVNKSGKCVHVCTLTNAKNKDWEDITKDDKGNLYIGDFGNNENKRTDLCVYKVSIDSCLKNKTVKAQKISFSYPEQTEFPPEEANLNYDAEAMAYYNDSLYIFTKCRTLPWTGRSLIYSLSVNESEQKAHYLNGLFVGPSGWWQDAITAADISGDRCYLLTYNRLMVYRIKKGQLDFEKRFYLQPITQKEAIAVSTKGEIFIGDELHKLLGGGYLYQLKANE